MAGLYFGVQGLPFWSEALVRCASFPPVPQRRLPIPFRPELRSEDPGVGVSSLPLFPLMSFSPPVGRHLAYALVPLRLERRFFLSSVDLSLICRFQLFTQFCRK